jgi:hypothetical protein
VNGDAVAWGFALDAEVGEGLEEGGLFSGEEGVVAGEFEVEGGEMGLEIGGCFEGSDPGDFVRGSHGSEAIFARIMFL